MTECQLRPPTKPVETEDHSQDQRGQDRRTGAQAAPALKINIAELQAMSMTDLNAMARDLGIENFGTMRKHEIIFHILQKNAERSGVLFSEGVLEVLSEGFGFLRSQSFNYLPCPEDIQIPEALRLRNLAVAYEMEEFGRYRYRMFENASHWYPGKKADKCTGCGDCLPRCPEKLDIPALLKETHACLFAGEGKRLWANAENS